MHAEKHWKRARTAIGLSAWTVFLACANPVEVRDDGRAVTAAEPPRETAQAPRSTCRSAKELAELDGRPVRLVGIYRRSSTAIKMRGERKFRGYVHIELEGDAKDIRPQASPGTPIVELVGKRTDEEVSEFVDQLVRVDGTLVLDPYKAEREAEVNYATVIFGPPKLRNPSNLSKL